MCELCNENGEMQTCTDCGQPVCLDCEFGDDVIRPACVTPAGILYCDICSLAHDSPEPVEEIAEDDTEDPFVTCGVIDTEWLNEDGSPRVKE